MGTYVYTLRTDLKKVDAPTLVIGKAVIGRYGYAYKVGTNTVETRRVQNKQLDTASKTRNKFATGEKPRPDFFVYADSFQDAVGLEVFKMEKFPSATYDIPENAEVVGILRKTGNRYWVESV